jgi:broad specificity phosphatase PhoE
MKKIVYLIRHAMPQQPYHGRYDLPPGPALSAVGREQADRLGRFLPDKGIERLYHSPLQRALETAAILSDYAKVPSQEQAALAEWRQGETAVAVRERVVQFWQETVMTNGAAVTAVVTHGGLIDQLLDYLSDGQLDRSQHRYWGGPSAPLAGVWRAALADGRWRLDLIFNPETDGRT